MTGRAQDIDLWLTSYDEITDAALHDTYRALLTRDEREQELRFHFPDDQRRYLVTRALVRTVLSRYLDVDPREWRFTTNRYRRPQIANPGHDGGRLRFNVSHTKGLIAVGVARHRELGVDVENVSARTVSIDIARRFFAGSEVAELARVPAKRRQDRFFEYWTFKESYTKARGMGLSLPLEKFSFDFPHEHAVRLAIEPELGDDAARWGFWQFRPPGDYLLAVCAERHRLESPAITIRRTVPCASEELLRLPLLRTSEDPAERLTVSRRRAAR